MKKIICLLIAVMLVVSVAAVSFSAAGSVSVTVVGLDGVSQTKTYNVGDTFKVYTTMKSSENDGKIASIKGEQTYTSGVLEVADATDEEGLMTDVDNVFPVTKEKSIANAGLEGIVHFSASTPSMTKPFIFDDDNCKLIVTTYKVVAEGSAEIKTTMTTLATSDMKLTKLISKGVVTDPSYEITVHSSLNDPDVPATEATVSGAITSYLTDADVTVKLTGSDNDFTATVTGKTDYTIENVPAGEYVLSVEKVDHATREYAVTVAGEDVAQDVKICPKGDVTQDGKTTQFDYVWALAYSRDLREFDDYQIACGDVFGKGDGKVTMSDATRIAQHARDLNPLYVVDD